MESSFWVKESSILIGLLNWPIGRWLVSLSRRFQKHLSLEALEWNLSRICYALISRAAASVHIINYEQRISSWFQGIKVACALILNLHQKPKPRRKQKPGTKRKPRWWLYSKPTPNPNFFKLSVPIRLCLSTRIILNLWSRTYLRSTHLKKISPSNNHPEPILLSQSWAPYLPQSFLRMPLTKSFLTYFVPETQT